MGGAGCPRCRGGRWLLLHLEAVWAIVEQCRAPGVGEVEPIEARLARPVLSRSGRVDPPKRLLRQQFVAEVDWCPPGPHGAAAAAHTPANPGRRDRQASHGAGALRGGICVPRQSRRPPLRSLRDRAPGRCVRTRSSSRVAWSCRATGSALPVVAGRGRHRRGARRSEHGATATRCDPGAGAS